jgi:hypothetical protein
MRKIKTFKRFFKKNIDIPPMSCYYGGSKEKSYQKGWGK